MQSRQKDDNAEGLWRVHDTLYDLTNFISLHPGGADWIKLTKVIPCSIINLTLRVRNYFKLFIISIAGH